MTGNVRHRSRPVAGVVTPAARIETGSSGQQDNSITPDLGPDSEPSYDVGYGKPPRHSRFAAGTSGNPRGRPKGSRTINEHLRRELDRPVTIREGGRERRMPKREVIAKQLAKKGMEGDLKTISFIARLEAECGSSRAQAEQAPVEQALSSERIDDILGDFLALHDRDRHDAPDACDEDAGDNR